MGFVTFELGILPDLPKAMQNTDSSQINSRGLWHRLQPESSEICLGIKAKTRLRTYDYGTSTPSHRFEFNIVNFLIFR